MSVENVVDKIIQIAELAECFFPIPVAWTAISRIRQAVGYITDIMGYLELADMINNIIDNDVNTIEFTAVCYPGWHTIKAGVRADAAGALTGTGISVLVGQVSNLKIYRDALEGSWIPSPTEQNQWISYDLDGDGDTTTWWDYAIKDNAMGCHLGLYHPNSATHADNYVYRHRNGSVPTSNYLVLNNALGAIVYTDEYVNLDYTAGELDALEGEGTFEAWIKPMDSALYRGHIIYAGSTGDGWGGDEEIHLSFSQSGQFAFYIGDTSGNDNINLYSGANYVYTLNDRYYHVAGTYFNRGGNLTANLYVDGVNVADSTLFRSASLNINGVKLGKSFSSTNPRYFRGKMKGMKISGRMQTDEEILLSYWKGGGDTVNPSIPVISAEPQYSPSTTNLISWTASTDDISGVAGYVIECRNNSTSVTVQDTISSISYIYTGREHGVSYSYRVAAIDNAENSSSFTGWQTSIQDTLPPTQSTMNPEYYYTLGTSNRVSWSASSDSLSDVSYWAQCAIDSAFVDTLHIIAEAGWLDDLNYDFSDLQIDETYYYRVKSRDEAGNESPYSYTVYSEQDDGTHFNTHYVSPFGDDSIANGTLAFPWRNIQTAIDSAATGSIIKILDDGDSTTVDYQENSGNGNGNIYVHKSVTIERYDDDDTRPQVMSANTNTVFYIDSNNVTIRGLDIYGATAGSQRGIYLHDISDCIIEDNRIGLDSTRRNRTGIYQWDPFQYNQWDSSNTIIRNNVFNSNIGAAMSFENSCYVDIYDNVCNSDALLGIEITGNSYCFNIHNNTINLSNSSANAIYMEFGRYNSITKNNSTAQLFLEYTRLSNISGNRFTRLYVDNGGGYNNTIVGNTFDNRFSNVMSVNNTSTERAHSCFFLNTAIGSVTSTLNRWISPIKLGVIYDLSNHASKSYLGNFYSAYTGSDIGNDGIGDVSYSIGSGDNYPLIDITDNYSLQVWCLGNDSFMYQGDISTMGGVVDVNTSSSHIWVSDQAATQDIQYQAGIESENTSWTGLISVVEQPSDTDSIYIEIGYADNQDGNGFSAQGPQARLNGQDFDLDTSLYYCGYAGFTTNAHQFTLPQGKYLAIRLTNASEYLQQILVGGSRSLISSPSALNENLVANFTVNDTLTVTNYAVDFTDLSTITEFPMLTWEWDFNNDGTVDSNEQDPEWYYDAPGTYTVSLTVTDTETRATSTEIKTDYITVIPMDMDIGLVASFPFDGTADDVSGNEFHGSDYGVSYTSDRFGNANSAVSFDNTDCVYFPYAPKFQSLSSASVSLWMKTSQTSNFILIEQGLGNLQYPVTNFCVEMNDASSGTNGIGFSFPKYNTGTQLTTTGSFTNNLWVHYVFTKDVIENRMKIYQNNILLAEMNIADFAFSPHSLYLGRAAYYGSFYCGLIDDMYIYERALTEDEIDFLYTPALTVDFTVDETTPEAGDSLLFTDLS
ncbi:MAG: PKD domain-containing protein, partial [Candidatus Cloacimonetes bacterium]|nr:PKD domain-containing protein [Candidatus Cloacimonadota bacterium]